jgi:hypothetical protein
MSEHPDHEDYDIDWSSLTPAQATIVREFGAALREIRENETALLRFYVRNLELVCAALCELNAELGAELNAKSVPCKKLITAAAVRRSNG